MERLESANAREGGIKRDTTPARASEPSGRLIEVDALRGLAAAMVALFHYTTRYDQLFVHTSPPLFSVPWGHLGVNLFFMVSGFVIFMTLDKTQHPFDFIVSRFSRLYPVYWVGILVTLVVTAFLPVPGKDVGLLAGLLNFLMFHGLFGVEHVDGVYWTLEVELLFYAAMLGLWTLGWLKRPHLVITGWLALQVAYLGLQRFAGFEIPYILTRFLILQYIPYFAAGMVIYLVARKKGEFRRVDGLLLLMALCAIVMRDGWERGAVAVVLASLLALAVLRPPTILRLPLLLWLGAISYPLYLLHENIGWGVILALEARDISSNFAILIATSVALAFASLLHQRVEMPAMRWIRERYRKSLGAQLRPGFSGARWAVTIAAIIAAIAVESLVLRPEKTPEPQGWTYLDHVQMPAGAPVGCPSRLNGDDPFVILALGQSNAGNHGELSVAQPTVTVFYDGRCYRVQAPLAGGTGTGGSIWPWLADAVQAHYPQREVVVAVLAVDASEIRAWSQDGPLNDRLAGTVSALTRSGLQPSVVLWQQGEADAKLGHSAEHYFDHFQAVMRTIRENGAGAPMLVALSSYCRGNGGGIVRRAQMRLPDGAEDVYLGPDTDSLRGKLRSDDCHFSATGLKAAAALWSDSIERHGMAELVSRRSSGGSDGLGVPRRVLASPPDG